MSGKIGITLEDLKGLAVTASRTGTEREFICLAMQWAEEAVKEVERLRSELGDVKADRAFAESLVVNHETKLRAANKMLKETESACLRAGLLQCDTCGKWRNKLLLSLCCKDKDNE